MNKEKEFTSLLGEVPALTQDAEGQLKGGFAVVTLSDNARGINKYNKICEDNGTCIGNETCIGNGSCTGPWRPTDGE